MPLVTTHEPKIRKYSFEPPLKTTAAWWKHLCDFQRFQKSILVTRRYAYQYIQNVPKYMTFFFESFWNSLLPHECVSRVRSPCQCPSSAKILPSFDIFARNAHVCLLYLTNFSRRHAIIVKSENSLVAESPVSAQPQRGHRVVRGVGELKSRTTKA